jgi:outer membrane protein assembly factor BamE (lipoprotein component of BamABCDE complex)
MKPITVLICLCLIFSGCASVGKEIKQSNIEQLENGKTTKSQVLQMFGKPDSVYLDGENNEVLSYFHSKASNTAWNFIPVVSLVHSEMKMKNQVLVLAFDKSDILKHYSFTDPDKTMSYGIAP